MDVGTADAAVGDFDVDVGGGEGLGGEGFPAHEAFGGGGVVGEPAVEKVGRRHGGGWTLGGWNGLVGMLAGVDFRFGGKMVIKSYRCGVRVVEGRGGGSGILER